MNQGNFQAAAQYMTSEQAQEIENANQTEMQKANQMMQAMDISVKGIQQENVQGDTANVVAELEISMQDQTQTSSSTFNLVKENGEWKIQEGMQSMGGAS